MSRKAELEDALLALAEKAETAAEFPLDRSLVTALGAAAEEARAVVGDRITYQSYDGKTSIQTGQGKDCVLLMFRGDQTAGVVLSSDEAEALGTGLIRRARYSRRAE